ncbi:hypothetical protein WG66_013425 [Moniliophthora roreri]|nr:hypothetical protein WG66_013425 [Moniliophthora roreri]
MPTLDDYLTASICVVNTITSLSAMFFVYGLYTALFIFYIRILCDSRGRNQTKTLYFWPTIVLFFLATLVVIGETIYRSIYMYITFKALQTKHFEALITFLRHDPRKTTGIAFTNICAVLLNAVADYILIHRCYVIWGFRKRISIPLITASIAANVVGMVGSSMMVAGIRNTADRENEELYSLGNDLIGIQLLMSVIVNMLITTLTAGRIWWMQREVHVGEAIYKSISRIIMESGLIYPIFTLVHLVTIHVMSLRDIPFDFSCISFQAAGIAPTLITVRAQLGKTIESMMCDAPVASEINFSSCSPRSDGISVDSSRAQFRRPSDRMEVLVGLEEMRQASSSPRQASSRNDDCDKIGGGAERVLVDDIERFTDDIASPS